MRRLLITVLVFVCMVSAVSCSKKKKDEISGYEEQVSKEIKAEEGGTVESSDGKTSVDIPAGALDDDTTITMTIYDAEGYSDTEGRKVISKVVDFGPNGTIFKKPVIIKMTAGEDVKGKTIAAAVYNEAEKKWSYSQGFYVILGDGRTEAGDPIMHTTDGKEIAASDGNLTTAAGDPIMMTNAAGDPIMTNAAGDPIMMSAAGDPIMLASENAAGDPIMTSAAGDPIMTSAAGDPIMNAAAGDPIMMTTGHFTAYTFIVFDPREGEQVEPVDDSDDTDTSDVDVPDEEIPDETGDKDEIPDETDDEDEDVDVIPEPDPVYSKVLCTGTTRCVDGYGSFIDCPKEGEELYGQEAQYATKKSCVPAKYTKIAGNQTSDSGYTQVVDEVTGLTWVVDIVTDTSLGWDNAKSFCAGLDVGGYEDWRLPTPKELMSIANSDTYGYVFREFYFPSLYYNADYLWARQEIPGEEGEVEEGIWTFNIVDSGLWQLSETVDRYYYIKCVRGEEYGKVAASYYTSETVNGEEMIHDSSTDLFWQKNAVSEMSDWEEALAYCENLTYAGKSDWRLPNRNELLTLVDYSKAVIKEPSPSQDPEEEIIASSFPGMTADIFITATPAYYYGGINGVWSIDMGSGAFTSWPDTFSVRCVRSDLDGYPEGMNMPYCDETGIAPCKDKVSGHVWSSFFTGLGGEYYDQSIGGFLTDRMTLAKGCRAASFAGSKKWRIPTIDEVRTLATNCGELKANGECNISESCNDFSPDCYDEGACIIWEGCESDLNDYGHFLSSTIGGGPEDEPWTLDFKDGKFDATDEFTDGIFRCIWDETIPEVEFPYTDSETELTWSEISSEELVWGDINSYCADLGNGWRLPKMAELSTLLQGCSQPPCAADFSGKYSKFGDIEILMSSESVGEDGENIRLRVLNFLTASEGEFYDWDYGKVRCVSGGE